LDIKVWLKYRFKYRGKTWYYHNLKNKNPSKDDIDCAIECIKDKFHYYQSKEIEEYELSFPPPKYLEELIALEKNKIDEATKEIKELTETLERSKKIIAFI